MLNEVCLHIKNFFCSDEDKHIDRITISNGHVVSPVVNLEDGQYFRIVGSTFNDGVYKYGEEELTDEVFDGAVWCMKLPKAFLDLVDEMEVYASNNPDTPFTSESFGGYSYSKSTGANGAGLSVLQIYANRLNMYRRMRL